MKKFIALLVVSSFLLPVFSFAASALQVGSSGARVFEVQEKLITLGFLGSEYRTGYFGPLTQAAVRLFQSKYGVVNSGNEKTTGYGVVGPRTSAKMNSLIVQTLLPKTQTESQKIVSSLSNASSTGGSTNPSITSTTQFTGMGSVTVPQTTSGIQQAPQTQQLLKQGPTSFKRSDVLISPRGLSTLATYTSYFSQYDATGIAWTYAWNSLMHRQANENIPVQCAMPVWVPAQLSTVESAHCHDLNGGRISVSIMNNGTMSTFSVADVSSKEWQEYEIEQGKKMIDAGCTLFTQDDFAKNAHHKCSKTNDSPYDSQITTKNYYERVHTILKDYAKSKNIRISFSGNITNNQMRTTDYSWLFPFLDYLTAEFYVPVGTDPYKEMLTLFTKTKTFSSPSVLTIASNSRLHNQRLIATSYAMGIIPIVPFDVFIGRGEPRFTGVVSDYSAYYAFVRKYPHFFDEYIPLTAEDANYSAVVPATGFVTKVVKAPEDPNRIRVEWTRQSDFKSIAKNAKVWIENKAYTTVVESTVGYIYLPSSTNISVGDSVNLEFFRTLAVHSKKQDNSSIAHIVNWQLSPRTIEVGLDANLIPTPPDYAYNPLSAEITPLTFKKNGDRWISNSLQLTDWFILK